MLCSQLVSIAAKWPQKIGRFPQYAYLWFVSHNGSNSESSIYSALTNGFSCPQTSPLCSVCEGFFLLIMSYKIIFLDPMHPSLWLPIFAPSLSINFLYFFLKLHCVPFSSLQPNLPFLGSGPWWTSWPVLTVIHSASRQPAVASSLDRFSSIPSVVHRILSWRRGKQGKTHLVLLQMVQTLWQTAQFHPKTDSLHHRSAVTSPSLSPQQTSWLNASLSLSGTCTQTQRGKKTMEPNKHLAALSDSSAHCVNAADGVEWQRCLFPQQRN